jgi:hypothetical protein
MLPTSQLTGTITLGGTANARTIDVADRSTRSAISILMLFVLAAVVLKCYLWFRIPIGHDEFHCLSFVHAFERGEALRPLQNFHVHFFCWLDAVSGNEVAQAMAARAAMLLLLFGTCTCLFLLGTHLVGPVGGLFSVLCYLAFSYTVRNGATFRPDTPATFLFMLALYLFMTRRRSAAANVAAGVMMAIACLFTIKASLYFTAFALLALLRLYSGEGRFGAIRRLSYFGVSFLVAFFLLYRLHVAALPPAASGQEVQFLRASFSTFMFSRYYPEPGFLVPSLVFEPLTWILLVLGLGLCLYRVVTAKGTGRTAEACLLAMFAPALSLCFFRNTAGYFYVFILPSAMLLCGYSVNVLKARIDRSLARIAPVCIGVLAIAVVMGFPRWLSIGPEAAGKTASQRELCSAIDRMFPNPVPYIDGTGMVASFPNAGFFMSSACIQPYLKAGYPFLKERIAKRKPVLLVANVPHLDLNSERPPKSVAGLALLEEDWTAMRAHFIHHWGPIWVAGKQFELQQGGPPQPFEILTPGPYTVEGNENVLIDGRPCRSGQVLELRDGMHTIAAGGSDGAVTLRWGNHLYRAENEIASQDLFMGELG